MKTLESAAVLQSIVERISRITPDPAARWGRMNAHQMLCHLTDSYHVPTGGRKTSMATGIFQGTAMKYGALYIPLQWPKGIATLPEIDQLVGGTAPTQFEADRAKLIGTIHRFAVLPPDFEWPPHPIFMHLSRWEWMRWGYLHPDHHLRQFGG
jgi:Protein of unknown function (DUF1569)